MEYSLARVDENQKKINEYRPLTGRVLENVRDYYRVSLTYTSNAIEGNTLTESETKVILEDGLTVGGHPLREILEVAGHGLAYDFMWSLIAGTTISEAEIKELHSLFYQKIDSDQAGVYRTCDVIITGSAYEVPHWQNVPEEMERLAVWIKTERDRFHPVVFAAELHWRFVYIHPFIDGNGRTARLLMNLALLQKGYEIVTIPPVVRSEYISALEGGHKNPNRFNDFIIDREVESQKDMIRLFHIAKLENRDDLDR